jgi:predicted ArsR family transcriptional regulator
VAPPLNKGRRVIKINALTQAKLIALMLEGVYTCEQLAEETGLHYVTVLQYARELHRAGAAHISSWEKDSRGRDVIKVYQIGKGPDAKREKLTSAQRQARYRNRKRALAMCQMVAGRQS